MIKKEIFPLLLAFAVAVVLYLLFNFHYALNHDTWYYNFTSYKIIKEQLLSGIFPLWNNYEALGMRLIDKGALDLFSIPLLYFLSVKSYIVIVGFIYLLMAIYFMHRYLISEGIQQDIALSAGAIWALNGFFLWHLHEFAHPATCIFIPLVLLTVKRMASTDKLLLNWIFFVLLNGVQLSYGMWDLYEYSVWAVFLYIAIVVKSKRSDVRSNLLMKLKLIGLASIGILCAFIIIGPFSIPYVKTILNSYRAASDSSFYVVGYYKFESLMQHLFPNTGQYDSRSYMSLFGVIFAILTLSLGRMKSIKLYAMSLVLLYILLAYPFKVYELVRMIPLHSGNINIIRIAVLFHLGISILFAFGLQEFIQEGRKNHYVAIIVFTSVLLLFGGWYVKYRHLGIDNYLSVAFFLVPIAVITVCKSYGFERGSISKLFVAYIVGYTFVFSFIFNKHDFNDGSLSAFEEQMEAEPGLEYIAKLQELTASKTSLPWRAINDHYFHPSLFPRNKIETFNFYGQFPSKMLCEVTMNIFNNSICYNSINDFNFAKSLVSRTFLSLASVKYVLIKNDDCQKRFSEKEIYYSDNEICVVENSDSFDRIRFVSNYNFVPYNESIEYLKMKNVAWFKNNFIIDVDPNLLKRNTEPNEVTWKLVVNRPNRLSIDVSSLNSTMMIISNGYSDSWKVMVDGMPDLLYRVNGLFQGVKIKPGKHSYEIFYSRDIF